MLTDDQLRELLRIAYKMGFNDGERDPEIRSDKFIDSIMEPLVHPSGYDGRGNPVTTASEVQINE